MTQENIPKQYQHFIEKNSTTWAQQESLQDLGQMLAPRGNEVFTSNEYYGLDLIVKAFLDLDPSSSLKFGVPHGVELGDDGLGNVYGLGANISTLTYNNPIGLRNMLVNRVPGWKFPAEHPFLILINQMNGLNLFQDKLIRKATLFFPAHLQVDVNFVNSNYDQDVCSKLVAMREDNIDIEISLPGIDIFLNRHLVYEKAGFKVVSSGNIFDPYFLSRFINLVSSYDQISTSEIGSHTFYTAALGIRTLFWDLGLPKIQPLTSQRRVENNYSVEKSVEILFQHNQFLQKDIAEKYLGGTGGPISRNYWNQLHEDSIKRDRYSFLEPVGNSRKFTIPRVLRRSLVKHIKKS